VFAIKRHVIKALLTDPEWSRRLEKAETSRELIRILEDFCRTKGFKVVVIAEKET